jgi:fumarate reductase subunit D
MIDLKQAVAAFLTLGMLAMLINMMSNGPFLDADQASSEVISFIHSSIQAILNTVFVLVVVYHCHCYCFSDRCKEHDIHSEGNITSSF